jgi:hypothetical protein
MNWKGMRRKSHGLMKVLSLHLPPANGKYHKKLFQVAIAPSVIQTKCLPNTSKKHYCYINLPCEIWNA